MPRELSRRASRTAGGSPKATVKYDGARGKWKVELKGREQEYETKEQAMQVAEQALERLDGLEGIEVIDEQQATTTESIEGQEPQPEQYADRYTDRTKDKLSSTVSGSERLADGTGHNPLSHSMEAGLQPAEPFTSDEMDIGGFPDFEDSGTSKIGGFPDFDFGDGQGAIDPTFPDFDGGSGAPRAPQLPLMEGNPLGMNPEDMGLHEALSFDLSAATVTIPPDFREGE